MTFWNIPGYFEIYHGYILNLYDDPSNEPDMSAIYRLLHLDLGWTILTLASRAIDRVNGVLRLQCSIVHGEITTDNATREFMTRNEVPMEASQRRLSALSPDT